MENLCQEQTVITNFWASPRLPKEGRVDTEARASSSLQDFLLLTKRVWGVPTILWQNTTKKSELSSRRLTWQIMTWGKRLLYWDPRCLRYLLLHFHGNVGKNIQGITKRVKEEDSDGERKTESHWECLLCPETIIFLIIIIIIIFPSVSEVTLPVSSIFSSDSWHVTLLMTLFDVSEKIKRRKKKKKRKPSSSFTLNHLFLS